MRSVHVEGLKSKADAAQAADAARCFSERLDQLNPIHLSVWFEGEDASKVATLTLQREVLAFITATLQLLSLGKPLVVMQEKSEMTTQEAADFLNVSRPLIVQEIRRGKLAFRTVGTHRRIELEELVRYRDEHRKAQNEVVIGLPEMIKRMRKEQKSY